ncbi:hypothetical protein ACJ41O_006040 [Fusarium nematophilum]
MASLTRNTVLALLAGGIISRLNRMLNDRALSNNSSARAWDWQREIVLITGGSSGLGELVVRRLAEQSIKIIVFDVNEPRQPFPSCVHFYKVDITDSKAVAEAAKSLREQVGEPTVLVNNAGIGWPGNVLETSEERVRRVFEVNTISHFILVKEFVPSMVENDHGHVITVASMASYVTITGNTEYSCTKASAMAFHEGLRQDLLHKCNVKHVRTRRVAGKFPSTLAIIHPIFVRTPMTAAFAHKIKDILEPEPVAGSIVKQILDGKSGVVFLPPKLWGKKG